MADPRRSHGSHPLAPGHAARAEGRGPDLRVAKLLPFALISALAACHSAAQPGPRKLAFLAGGSGEPGENFFAEDLKDFSAALAGRGWQVSSLIASQALNAKILEGATGVLKQARAGDEVLVLFHSHGRERETQWAQRSHSIVSEDRDRTGNDPGFDLDALEPSLIEAHGRGVHLALVDLSCYSGTTQVLRGPDCTVTLAAPHYISLCSGRPEERHFGSRFFKLPPNGQAVDLEGQFLEARRADLDSVNLPEISSRSTPAADGWDAFLETVDPLDVYEDLKLLRTGTKPFDARKLLGPVDALARANPSLKPLRERIALEVAEAVRIRHELERAMPALAADYDRKLELQLPDRGVTTLSLGDLGDLLTKLGDPQFRPAEWDGASQAQKDLAATLKPERGRLMAKFSSELRAFDERRGAFDQLTDDLERKADELMNLERSFYRAASAPTGSSACRDFAL